MAQRKGNWKTKTKEDREKELEKLIELSNIEIENYKKNPDDMLEYMKFMSKFHKYSALNNSLIKQQFMGAVAVSSYEGWKSKGFQVQRGEKGIGIYVNAPVTVFVDDKGNQKTLREATPEEKEKIKNEEIPVRKIKHFKKGYVYDVSQTNAEESDLPKIFPNRIWNFKVDNEENLVKLENGVVSLANKLGISIKDMKDSNIGELGSAKGAYVQYIDGSEEIALNSRNNRTENVTTSVHELAHKRLHAATEKGGKYSTPEKEFQAEMVSFIVNHNYGIDTSEFTIPYIAEWTKNNQDIDPKKFREIVSGVRDTALEFIETIDHSIINEKDIIIDQTIETPNTTKQEDLALKNSFSTSSEKETKEVKIESSLREVIIDKISNNIDTIYQYNDNGYWYDQFDKENNVETVQDLSIDNIEKFYETHKQEIENTADSVNETFQIEFRDNLTQENYKQQMTLLAYKTTSAMLKKECREESFIRPENTDFKYAISNDLEIS